MKWERPVSPRLQRRATIDPLSILCPSRGGSTSPERHLDSSFPLQLEPGGKQQRWSVGHRPVAFGGLWQVPRCSPNSLFADTTVIGLRRGRDLRGRGRLGWARLHWRLDCLRWRHVALAGRRHLRGRSPREWARLHWWLGRLRWRRVTLAEVRILRFAICDELQIDLWLRFVARRGCGVPRMTGAMQSRKRPSPALALPCTNPACSQAALISAQGPWRGAACTKTAAPKPTINVPRMPPQNFTPGVRFQRLAQKVPPRDASLRLRRGRARPI
jgi:hypothetical protein